MPIIWKNREHAGRILADELVKYIHAPDTIVLGLPRGGVVTAAGIAHKLGLPLDIIVTRKISAPRNSEFAVGAVDAEGNEFLDEETIGTYVIPARDIEQEKKRQQQEAARRTALYRAGRAPMHLENKAVILVDDGIATGATMLLAIRACRTHGAKKVVVAVPVLPRDTLARIESAADEVVYLNAPTDFMAVGQYYTEFEQVTDDKVIALLTVKA